MIDVNKMGERDFCGNFKHSLRNFEHSLNDVYNSYSSSTTEVESCAEDWQ